MYTYICKEAQRWDINKIELSLSWFVIKKCTKMYVCTILSPIWVKSVAMLFNFGSFSLLENGVNEWSEILQISHWSIPTSNNQIKH
jgi:hypothetical protein